jgi:Zn-dependent protease with chaperone function
MSEFVQRDLGEAAEASGGGGAAGMRVEFWTLMGLAAVVVMVVFAVFLMAAELAVRWISAEQEAELLQGVVGGLKVLDEVDAPDDEGFQRAVAILQKLRSAEMVPKVDFRLVLLDEKQPNAFALPGGVIGVTRGLLDLLPEEVELAFVLGHEIGHFKYRDHLRGFFRDAGRTVALAMLFGDASGAVAGVDRWLAMSYSQEAEHRADRFGVELVWVCYGSAVGTERLFEMLAEKEAVHRWSHTFSTHPESRERVRRLRAYAAELEVADQAGQRSVP